MDIEALLFDMDGVLVQSIDSWYQALNAALEAYGRDRISKDEFVSTYWGGDLSVILKRLGLEQGIGPFCLGIYPEYVDSIKIFPETIPALEALDGYVKSLVTNTAFDCTDRILSRFGLHKYFNLIMTSDQVEKGKPYPDMITKACDMLGTDSKHVIMVGDTQMDILASRSAGCLVIGVGGVKGDYSIDSLSELPGIIKKLENKE